MKLGKRLPERRGVVKGNGGRLPQEQRVEEEASMKRRSPKSLIQRVFDLCNEVFRGPGTIPYPHDSPKMRHILDRMKADDVGLSEDFFIRHGRVVKGSTSPHVTYVHIYECQSFSIKTYGKPKTDKHYEIVKKLSSINPLVHRRFENLQSQIGIFLLPTTATIPLHNHPGMTVFSKLLFGSVHLKSYDWVEPCEPRDDLPPHVALARLKVDAVFTAPCNASVLYPASGGNLHSLQAVTPCAVLDVLGPPYSGPEGRDCTYYRELPYSSYGGAALSSVKGDPSCYRWLEEIEPPKPEEFPVDGLMYSGPRIMEGF